MIVLIVSILIVITIISDFTYSIKNMKSEENYSKIRMSGSYVDLINYLLLILHFFKIGFLNNVWIRLVVLVFLVVSVLKFSFNWFINKRMKRVFKTTIRGILVLFLFALFSLFVVVGMFLNTLTFAIITFIIGAILSGRLNRLQETDKNTD